MIPTYLRNHKTLLPLSIALLALFVVACAHRPSSVTGPKPVPRARTEPTFECVAEVLEVKQEAWQFRVATYSTNDPVWQGVLVISLRIISPAARAGEVYNLGVFEEREIAIGGRNLVRGDAIRFTASESVLERWVVPEVFSNLEEVARSEVRTEGKTSGPSTGTDVPAASRVDYP